MLTQKLDLPYYLMLIIDLDFIKKTFSVPDDFIFNSIKSGVNMVQVRDTKTEYANKLSLINKIKTKFNNNCTVIVNSDYRLASESNADGIQIKASEWGNFNFSNLRPNLLIGNQPTYMTIMKLIILKNQTTLYLELYSNQSRI